MCLVPSRYGRSYVFAQWTNTEDDIQAACDSCPVSCIHWVDKEELPVLEHVMAKLERTNVGIMMAGQGSTGDPFEASRTFIKRRRELEAKRAQEETRVRRRESEAQREARRQAAAEIKKRQQEQWGFSGLGAVFGRHKEAVKEYRARASPVMETILASNTLSRPLEGLHLNCSASHGMQANMVLWYTMPRLRQHSRHALRRRR